MSYILTYTKTNTIWEKVSVSSPLLFAIRSVNSQYNIGSTGSCILFQNHG